MGEASTLPSRGKRKLLETAFLATLLLATHAKAEPSRLEPPRLEPPRLEPPRLEPPRLEPPRLEPPRLEYSRLDLPRIVGGPAGGCIQGAIQLPPEGPGWQTIRTQKSFFWGHPATIAAIELLAARAHAASLPTLYINDISKPAGGPFPGVHASHMLGLDADIWLDLTPKPSLTPAQRDALEPLSLVRPDLRAIDPTRWTPQHTTLLRLATTLPGLDRILINPAIKKQLCLEVQPDRSWLHLVRPYYGHAAHMHLHFRCPPNQPECTDQPPPPPGEACDASLQWWFDQLDDPPHPTTPPRPPRPITLPAPCATIMAHPPG